MNWFLVVLAGSAAGLCAHALNVGHYPTAASKQLANYIFVGLAASIAFVVGAVID